MKILQQLRKQERGKDVEELLKHIPYAQFLGLQVERHNHLIMTILPFKETLVGNTNLPALHGGAVGAMMEMTALIQLIYDSASEILPQTIDVSFDYLRSARDQTTFGQAFVTRRGRRVANVRTELWQEDRHRPLAISHGHFLLNSLDAP